MAKATSKSKSQTKRSGRGSRASASSRADKSVQAYRDALDRSLTLSRERLQEVFDDAVERGRMTRADANELMSSLVTRGRKASDELIRDLEKLLDQARKEVESQFSRATRTVRDVADPALARADQVRRRVGAPGGAISGYDQLTAAQVKSRLADLSKPQLRQVRKHEQAGKARKSVLAEIDKRL